MQFFVYEHNGRLSTIPRTETGFERNFLMKSSFFYIGTEAFEDIFGERRFTFRSCTHFYDDRGLFFGHLTWGI